MIYMQKIRLNPCEVRLNQTLENLETLKTQKTLKIPVWTEVQ